MLLLPLSFYSHLHLLLFLAPLRIDRVSWQLVGHVPLNWSNVLSKFLHFTNYHVQVEIDWKESQSWCWIGTRKPTQLAQRRCDNVVTTSLLTLSQRCGSVENESCTNVGPTTLPQRCYNVDTTLSIGFLGHFTTDYFDLFPFIETRESYKIAKWH